MWIIFKYNESFLLISRCTLCNLTCSVRNHSLIFLCLLQFAVMSEEKTKWKEFLETLSALQWLLTFLFLGKSATTA